ncbi:MAG TPA: spore cortex-lytic enzyme [Firmicutes bacterium]|nr:spore cortex-lytic enzyme [Bacillota bacterium]
MAYIKKFGSLLIALILTLVVVPGLLSLWPAPGSESREDGQVEETITLWPGSQGTTVRNLQTRLKAWGYYTGPIDGVYGPQTTQAVRLFQSRNGLKVDGVAGPATLNAVGLPSGTTTTAQATATTVSYNRSEDLNLLSRVVAAEAEGEPHTGQVAVASVILNRVRHPSFPNTLSGVIFQPHAFESVSNGLIWRRTPSQQAINAARQALDGWDPTYGCLFFWNPAKAVSSWIWSRPIVTRIGNHVFAK